jgi:hypothetical protein
MRSWFSFPYNTLFLCSATARPRRCEALPERCRRQHSVRSKEAGIGNENNQADRAISTGKLHTLLRFHTRPINVVVFHGPV